MRIILLVASLIIGLFVSSATAQTDSLNIDLEKERTAAKQLINSGITLNDKSISDGRTKQGGFSSSTSYEFSDGVYLSISDGDYKTIENAQEFFEQQLKDALKILDQTDVHSVKDNSKIGAEALVIFGDGQKPDYIFVRLHWYKNLVVQTSSTSLKHLLAYELKNGKTQN